jgi:hypothetical protein
MLYQGRGPRAEGQEPGARGQGPGARGQGPGAKSQGPRAEGQGPRARGQGRRAEGQGPRIEGRGSRAEDRGPNLLCPPERSEGSGWLGGAMDVFAPPIRQISRSLPKTPTTEACKALPMLHLLATMSQRHSGFFSSGAPRTAVRGFCRNQRLLLPSRARDGVPSPSARCYFTSTAVPALRASDDPFFRIVTSMRSSSGENDSRAKR